MRRVRYAVAASLDGFIAGPKGEYDWIVRDPDIDFGALFAQFDTLLMGRLTFEVAAKQRGGPVAGLRTVVCSRTLQPRDYPGVTIVSRDLEETVAALRAEPGKDIWLFGGGALFRSLADLGLVDTVEVAVVPVLLGGGIPLLPPPYGPLKLTLTGRRVYEESGIVSLEYAMTGARRGRVRPGSAAP